MKEFFDEIRETLFDGALSQKQVDGINATLAAYSLYGDQNVNTLAIILATDWWETDKAMQPVTERGNRQYFNKYEPGTEIGKVLGNTAPGDGFLYRGRGDVMLTGRSNYARVGRLIGVDLVGNPDRALELEISKRILIEGTIKGWFTGKKLSDYIDDKDEDDAEDLREFMESRRVVNGTDRAREIGQAALIFERGLRAVPKIAPPTGADGSGQETVPGVNEPPVAPDKPRKRGIFWPVVAGLAIIAILAFIFL